MRALLGLIALAWLLAGCNTMEGLGKDIQKVGDQLEEKARKK